MQNIMQKGNCFPFYFVINHQATSYDRLSLSLKTLKTLESLEVY